MVFYELPAFEKVRESYLDDGALKELQSALITNPEAGDVIPERVAFESYGLEMPTGEKESAVDCA